MEDTLGVNREILVPQHDGCLNPCFSGRYSRRGSLSLKGLLQCRVLILVLVEDTLGAFNIACIAIDRENVLILVLVEDTLGAINQSI